MGFLSDTSNEDKEHEYRMRQIDAYYERQSHEAADNRKYKKELADYHKKRNSTHHNSGAAASAGFGFVSATPSQPAQSEPSSSQDSSGLGAALFAGTVFIGLAAIFGGGDKDPPKKAPETAAQPLKPGQTLDQAYKTAGRIAAENRLYIAAQDTEISIPFLRNGSIYEQGYMVEKGSCFTRSPNASLINAVQGTIAKNSPLKTNDGIIFGLANSTHMIVDQVSSATAPKSCVVMVEGIGNVGIAAPTEAEIKAMWEHSFYNQNYYHALENIDVFKSNAASSPIEYTLEKGSCLRVLGIVQDRAYIGANKDVSPMLSYDGYVDLSKLQAGMSAQGPVTWCTASLTSAPSSQETAQPAPAQDLSKQAPPAQDEPATSKPVSKYTYFRAAQDVVISAPYIRNGVIAEFNQTVEAGSCLRVENSFNPKNLTDTALSDGSIIQGYFDPRKVESIDESALLAEDCHATVIKKDQTGRVPQDVNPYGYMENADQTNVYISAKTVNLYDSAAESASIRYSFEKESCFIKNTTPTGSYNSFVLAIGEEGAILNGFLDLAELTPVPVKDMPDCRAKLVP